MRTGPDALESIRREAVFNGETLLATFP